MLALLLPLLLAAQVAPSPPTPIPGPAPAKPVRGLGPDEAAWIDNAQVITLADLDLYLATVEARKPPGQEALLQVLQEAIVDNEARKASISATEAEIDDALRELDKQAGGLAKALRADVDMAGLRNAVRLHVLQERLVRDARHMLPIETMTPDKLQSWMDDRVKEAALTEAPLEDPLAATWAGGTIGKAAVGAHLRAVLPKDDLAGVLTEMIGIQLVRRRADELGLQITPAEVTKEVLQRDEALKAHANGMAVNYKQYLDQVEHRSLQELLASDSFNTEVLMRLITERQWTEEQARAYWEKNAPAYKARGLEGDWPSVRNAVWKDIRGAAYKDLFTKSTIVRRY
jgi:hypothetical protein